MRYSGLDQPVNNVPETFLDRETKEPKSEKSAMKRVDIGDVLMVFFGVDTKEEAFREYGKFCRESWGGSNDIEP